MLSVIFSCMALLGVVLVWEEVRIQQHKQITESLQNKHRMLMAEHSKLMGKLWGQQLLANQQRSKLNG